MIQSKRVWNIWIGNSWILSSGHSVTSTAIISNFMVYGYCSGSAAAAVAEYRQRYPHRRIPDKATFSRVFASLRETGSFPRQRCDHQSERRKNSEAILQEVDEDPSISLRKLESLKASSLSYKNSTGCDWGEMSTVETNAVKV
ncbi:hypothetical protein FQR65_LT01048 [Abscondita terminalis]|nr:hypothetical protein FQR65_LT01048 [Abscondita terminalis]